MKKTNPRKKNRFRLTVLDEPKVKVGKGQIFTHPRDGLFLAGPLSALGQPQEIELGAIGTTIGLELFRQFCDKVRGFIAPRPKERVGPGLQRQPPSELFVHGRTRFNETEFDGFCEGAGIGTKVVAIRIRSDRGLKLFRLGEYPVLRGTALYLTERNGYLWTRGTVPDLRTYLGSEVPNPLHIEIVQGHASLESVMNDVMALTKVNFNGCMFADGLPVTLRFADSVAEILTSAPLQPSSPWAFKHYI